jgi:hypothetical protein
MAQLECRHEPRGAKSSAAPKPLFANGPLQNLFKVRSRVGAEIRVHAAKVGFPARTVSRQRRFTHKTDLAWCSAAVRFWPKPLEKNVYALALGPTAVLPRHRIKKLTHFLVARERSCVEIAR